MLNVAGFRFNLATIEVVFRNKRLFLPFVTVMLFLNSIIYLVSYECLDLSEESNQNSKIFGYVSI